MGAPPRKKAKQHPDQSDEECHASSYCSSDEDQVEETREEEPMTQAEKERRKIQAIMEKASTLIVLRDARNATCEGSPCLIDKDPRKYPSDNLKQLLVYRLSLNWSGMFSQSYENNILS